MPQPNMQQLLKQAQKMQQDMLAAQEALKDEVVEASAGGGMVTVKVTGDLVRQVDHDRPGGRRSRRRRAAPGHGAGGGQRGAALGPGARVVEARRDHRRPRRPGRPRRFRASASRRASPSVYAPPVQRLITELSKLPGVGGRTAQRLAFHLLRASDEEALALADAIREVKERIGLCETCFNLADGPSCRICADERRDPELICVVEEPSDVISIERTHEFRGRYHVLGGALSPIDGVDPEDLKIAELYARVRDRRGPRGRDRHQPDHHRGGDGAAHRRRAARARRRDRGHAARERAARRRGPRVRRRADARAGAGRAARGLGAAGTWVC